MDAAELCQWKSCAAAFSFVLQETDFAKLAKSYDYSPGTNENSLTDEKASDWAKMR